MVWWKCCAVYGAEVGGEKTRFKTIDTSSRMQIALCRVIWIWAVLRIDHKLSYVMTAYPVTWLIGAVLIALYVWKGKWMPEAYYRMKKEV